MPPSAISGFVKKRTASQRYKRSPRQLTRDITLAIELQDEKILPNLRIRTEDGEVVEGTDVTPDLVKTLREEGRNPMWYLRRTWLEETFERREKGDDASTEGESDDDSPQPEPIDTSRTPGDLTTMLKESIQELRQDKEHLKAQLAIKDEQIRQTTDRWKESNVLTQNLHKRIDTMEQQMETLLLGPGAREVPSVEVADVVAAEEETASANGRNPQERETPTKEKPPVTKRTSKKLAKRRKPAPAKPKWYEMPTVGRLASRFHRS